MTFAYGVFIFCEELFLVPAFLLLHLFWPSVFIKDIELKLVSEAICYAWLSHFSGLAEFLSLVQAPAMKVLLYCELGVKRVLIMLQCLCAVRSVRKLR